MLGKGWPEPEPKGASEFLPHHHNHMLLGDTLKSTRVDEREMKQQGNSLELLEAVRGTLWRTKTSPQGGWQLLPHPSPSSERVEGPFPRAEAAAWIKVDDPLFKCVLTLEHGWGVEQSVRKASL